MKKSAQQLFHLIDRELNRSADNIKDMVFSKYQNLLWKPEDRGTLEPAVRDELERLIQGILGALSNVGGVLPDETPLTYSIMTIVGEDEDAEDVSDGFADYSSLWLDYLIAKES